MAYILLDTETTGLYPANGHRIIEIGCLEMDADHMPTGRTYHQYVNPEREVPLEAYQVSKLSYNFLKDYPVFKNIVDDFLNFIQDQPLVIHNASFDMGFLNSELAKLNRPLIQRNRAICTLRMAQKKFPGAKNNLDSLCQRFKIDLTSRKDGHGALIDIKLLSKVYLGLLDKLQARLDLTPPPKPQKSRRKKYTRLHPSSTYELTEEEQARHAQLLNTLTNPLWTKYI